MDPSSKVLSMDFSGSGGEAAVGIPVTWPSSGTVLVSFRMRPQTTNQNIYVLPVRGDRRIFDAVPFQRTGLLAHPSMGPTYTAGTWVDIGYEIRLDSGDYRIYADGTEVASGPFASSSLPCALPGGNYLSLHGGYVDQKWKADLDDLTVTHQATGCSEDYALVFDGPTDRATVANTTGLYPEEVTYEAHISFDAFGAGQQIVLMGEEVDWRFMYLRVFGGMLRCDFGTGSGVQTVSVSTGTLRPRAMHHIACTRTSTEQVLWVDGVEVDRTPSTNYARPTATLYIGSHPRDATGFRGAISDVRISNGARYSTAFTPQRPLMVDGATIALWNFDEGSGSTSKDTTGGGHDASLVDTGWTLSLR